MYYARICITLEHMYYICITLEYVWMSEWVDVTYVLR